MATQFTLPELEEQIKERAEQKLRKDLYEQMQSERSVLTFLGKNPNEAQLSVDMRYDGTRTNGEVYQLTNEFTKQVFNTKLSAYVDVEVSQVLSSLWELDHCRKLLKNHGIEDDDL